MKNVKPTNKDELMQVVADTIARYGNNCDLNFIDTSLITDMSNLFLESKFTGDISEWDVSSVEDMFGMFQSSEFNGDISKWNVSRVKTKRDIFFCCPIKPEYKPKGL